MILHDDHSKMISIIVSTYNRSDLLNQTLSSLCMLDIPFGIQIEVIICDDGSDDNTFSIVRQYEKRLRLRFCYQPDSGYRVAAVRNMGIRLARGQLVLFLDSGVLAAPNLLKEHLVGHALAKTPIVILGQTYRYRLQNINSQGFAELEDLRWWENHEIIEHMTDPRDDIWKSIDYQMNRLSAPWTLCWGNNISVPRQALLNVSGFDEEFEGWGAEDVDLGLRLYLQGLTFHVSKDAQTLHLPHDKSSTNPGTNHRNKKRIFNKFPSLATELLPYCSTKGFSSWYDELIALASHPLIPDYLTFWDDTFKSWIKTKCKAPLYIFGAGKGELGNFLNCTWMSDPSQNKVEYAKQMYPWIDVTCCFGLRTKLNSRQANTTVITDYWRAFPEEVVRAIIEEALNISDHCIILCTISYETPQANCGPKWNTSLLANRMSDFGLDLVEIARESATNVYEISKRREG